MKNAIRKILAFAGFELRRASSASVPFENFANLSVAYEKALNRDGEIVPYNAIRPKLLARLMGTPPSEAYFIVQALAKCKDLPGDVCEFGVAQGETSALIGNEIALTSKILHLFDSFEGLPKPTEKDKLKDDILSLGSINAYAGAMSNPEDLVIDRLRAISFPEQKYVIHKGFIEKLIHERRNLPVAVSFAYVDFDFYEPIKIALEFLHVVGLPGTVIIVDDYDYFSTGVKTAVDEFVEAKKLEGAAYELQVPDAKYYGHFAILTKVGK